MVIRKEINLKSRKLKALRSYALAKTLFLFIKILSKSVKRALLR